jgi:tetratricopeptide (TPR) repeat protein
LDKAAHLKPILKNIFYSAFALLLIASCSRKKNSFISRNLHAVGTEYNVLYNGDLALQAGLDQLEASYIDDYWSVLPVERLKVKDEVFLPGDKPADPNFERAEEKAVKAVQKHSMLIDEQEYNPQVDDAYLLLGKARYYDQRYINALEAFNYILQFMPDSDNRRLALVWRERTNMRLDNNETAIRNLQKLLKEDEASFRREDFAIANATLSQAYLNLKQVDSAIVYMNKAASQTRNKETIARYKFIAAQLFAKAGNRDSAFVKYDELIKLHRNIPRRYYVNAYIEKIKLFNEATDSKEKLLATITTLEENRENRPWLDAIYARKAIYHHNQDSIKQAITYYNKALRAPGTDTYLRGNNYASLGDISFNQALYERSGKYFDSAYANYKERTPEYRLTGKKIANLEDVILYESRRRYADSIFNVIAMSKEEQETYYQDYITTLKKEEERIERQAAIEEAKEAQNQNAFQTISQNNSIKRPSAGPGLAESTPSIAQNSVKASTFYFYNQGVVDKGKRDFRGKWGRRKLEDNWRRKNKKTELTNEQDVVTQLLVEEETRPEHTTAFYINELHKGKMVLDSIAVATDFAYYQLGVIYKEKFKRNDLAINRFTTLIDRTPEEKILLPTLYNLYLIYKESNAFAKAESLKALIISTYPGTRYAQILSNPDATIDDNASPIAVYNRLYKEYEKQNHQVVILQAENYVKLFNGDEIVPRLELLKSFAAGRLYGYDEYKKGIDYVALNFPNTEVGKSAQKLVTAAESLRIPRAFMPDKDLADFKLIYRMAVDKLETTNTIVAALNETIIQENYGFKVSVDVYSPAESIIVVHGLTSKMGAQGLAAFMKKPENKYNIKQPFIAIATENYKTIQIYKNLDAYEKEML